jgi:hypothetical protein
MGQMYLFRTVSAGVHIGEIVPGTESTDGKKITLTNSSRIWRWEGANTLSELANHGPKIGWTRISERVEEITLTEVIEKIKISSTALYKFQPQWGE